MLQDRTMCFVSLIVPVKPQAENKFSAWIDKRVINNKKIISCKSACQQTIKKSQDFKSSHFFSHPLVILVWYLSNSRIVASPTVLVLSWEDAKYITLEQAEVLSFVFLRSATHWPSSSSLKEPVYSCLSLLLTKWCFVFVARGCAG